MIFFHDSSLQAIVFVDPEGKGSTILLDEIIAKADWIIRGLNLLPNVPVDVHRKIIPIVHRIRGTTKAPISLWMPTQ